MKNIIAVILLFFSVKGIAQTKGAPLSLINCWSASYEEDKENSKENMYRSCDYKFPPKIYRPTVKFNTDGTCQVLRLGPTDTQDFVNCKWTYNKRKKLVTVINSENKTEMKFCIKHIEPGLMKTISKM